MKITPLIVLLLLCLAKEKTIAQGLEGIWISSHEIQILKVHERIDSQDPEFAMVKLDHEEIDTNYIEMYLIIDFISNKEIIMMGIGGRQLKLNYTYSKKNGKINIKSKQGNLKGRVEKGKLILTDKISRSETNELFFQRITPSELTTVNMLDSSSFYNTNWLVEADSSSFNFGFNFHFVDSNIVIISQDFGTYGYTNWGEFQITSYKNHLFLGFLDRMSLEHKVYHLYDRSENTLIGNTFEHYHFAIDPPPLKHIKLSKKVLLNSDQISLIESQLFGKWKAVNDPIPFDKTFGADTLLNQHFEIEFRTDKNFTMLKSGTITKDSVETQKEVSYSGNWKLSETGKYIELRPIDSWTRYLTISKITMHYLEIYYEIEALDMNLVSSEMIIMRK